MNYFSPEFALTLLLFVIIYWSIKSLGVKAQNKLILIFNYAILTYINPYFAIVVGIYTVCLYMFSRLLYKIDFGIILALGITLIVLTLSFFKYSSDIKDSINEIFALFGLDFFNQNIIFPLGIMFYSFCSIMYLCQVYRTRNYEKLYNLAIYLSFFPTFISGPMFTPDRFFFQLHDKNRSFNHLNSIFMLIIFAIFQKVFLATYLQEYSDSILQNPSDYNITSLLCGIYAYGLRIYCDFSGYVNLMRAFGLMLGFSVPSNFYMPYAARNIREFWTRWHITLTLFIRDHIYIPLGGSRKGFFRTQICVLIAFSLSGIWHGNTINFLIWGLLHAFGLIILNICTYYKISFPAIFSQFVTINFVMFAWIFFYYENLNDALFFIESFYLNAHKSILDSNVIWLLFLTLLFLSYRLLDNFHRKVTRFIGFVPLMLRPFLVSFFIVLIIGLSTNGVPNFIYAGF